MRSVQVTGPNWSAAVARSLDRGPSAAATVDPAAPATTGFHAVVPITNGAQLVGLVWNGAPATDVQLRSHTAGAWSAWTDLDSDGSEAPDTEGHHNQTIGPVWVGDGTDSVEFSVNRGALADLRLDAIRVDRPSAGFGIPTAGASAPYPGIIGRDAWGAEPWASQNSDCGSGPKVIPPPGPRLGVVHHTVTTNSYSPSDSYSIIKGIQYFHIHSNGWCDIAYNLLVDRYGQIFEGRAGGVDKGIIGGHTRGFNSVSFGTALLGDFSSVDVPTAMRDALHAVLSWKFSLHGIDANANTWVTSQCDTSFGDCRYPAGDTVLLPTLIGHRDVNLTACPGGNAYPMTWELRGPVANDVLTNGPYNKLPYWTPQPSGPRVLTLEALGGLHPAGAAGATFAEGYWPYPAARGITGDANGGYVVDGSGAVHQYGSAPAEQSTAYWPGQDIARAVTGGPISNSGYVLDWWGGVHPFGGAPFVTASAYWSGWDIARDIVALPGGLGGYVLDGWGALHPYGTASKPSGGPYWQGWDIARAVALRPDGPGGYVLDGWGGVHPFGGAPQLNVTGFSQGNDVFRDLVILPGGIGYSVDVYGVVWPIGGAPGAMMSQTWTGYPISRGIVASPS